MQAGAIALGAKLITVTPTISLTDVSSRLLTTPLPSGAQAPTTLPKPVYLEVEGVQYQQPPGAYYEIYLNLPENQAPNFESIYYVGNLSFFGHMHNATTAQSPPQVLDITSLILSQIQAHVWKNPPQVSLVLQGVPPSVGAPITMAEGANASISGIQITDTL